MPHRPPPDAALAAVVRDRLAAGEKVVLPGLGVLRCDHEPARIATHDDGRRILMPPRETIVFVPHRPESGPAPSETPWSDESPTDSMSPSEGTQAH